MATISGAVFNDYDADAVRDAGEPGLSGWTVFIDEDGNGTLDGVSESRPSTDTPLPMPDDRTTRFSNLNVSGIGVVSDLNVVLNIGHTFIGDLDIYLIGPNSTRIDLTTDNGSGTDGMNVTLDDEATSIVTAFPTTSGTGPVTGSWRPEQALSAFDGVNADGLWQLEWTDDAGGDFGTLNSWSLTFSSGEQSRVTAADGTYSFANLAAGSHIVRQINQAGFNQTGPAGGFHTINLVDAGSTAANTNFGNRQPPGTITGTLFGDYNGDGTRQGGEPGLAGWTVYADVDSDGTFDPGEFSAVTAADGSYSIEAPPGSYKLRAVPQAGFTQTAPGADDGTGGWRDGIDGGNNGFADDLVGRDFWSNDNDPNPSTSGDDHGTHVAGIAAGRTNNGVGVAGTAGGATIVPIRFYATSGGTWTATDVLEGYTYAANNGVKILTTSYNVDGFVAQQAFRDALNYMYNNGVMHFNSAGNNSATNPPRQQYDTSLYVVNTQMNDVRNTGSNIGWGVDISAPGTGILSSALGGTTTTYTYESFTGTSMASPNAAAVAALIWSKNPTWTREQVAAQLIGTADNINALQTATANGLVGSGRVNSNKALNNTLLPPRFKNTTNTPLLPGLPAEGATVGSAPTSFTLDVANVFDPATMIASNFELRGDGADQTFNTPDDTLIPFTLRFGDAAAPTHGYQIGTNRLFFTSLGAMAPDRYRFTAKAELKDPFGQALDGNNDGVGGDALTRTFIVGAARGLPAAPPSPVMNDLSPIMPDMDISNTEILVRVNDARGLRALDQFVRANPGSALASMINVGTSSQLFKLDGDSLVTVKLQPKVDPMAAIAEMSKLSLVQYAEPNYVFNGDPREFTPNDPSFPSQGHHPLMQNNLAWDTTLGDPRVKIGVTDDGFATSHPDLYQNIWVNQAEIPATRLANLTDINADGYISMVELNDPVNIGAFKINDTNSDGRIDAVDLMAARGGSDGSINVVVTAGQTSVVADFGQEDNVAPLSNSSSFTFEVSQRVNFGFNEDVSSSLSAADLVLTNVTTATAIAAADLAVSYDAGTNTGSFAYTAVPNGVLPDGNYTAVIAGGSVADPYGNALAGPISVNFFVLGGDANRDRGVNISDFSILAANFNQSGIFSTGDFNYDGTTGINDFSILAANFNKTLPEARAAVQTLDAKPQVAPQATVSLFSSQPIGVDRLDRLIDQLEEFAAPVA